MLNHIVCQGRLTADPELKQTASGVDYCTFTLAVDRDYKNGDEKICDFFSVTAWRGTAKFVSSYFGKGRMAVVSGAMESHKYQDKDGNNRTIWGITAQSVYFADSKKDAAPQTAAPAGEFREVSDDGEPLPF